MQQLRNGSKITRPSSTSNVTSQPIVNPRLARSCCPHWKHRRPETDVNWSWGCQCRWKRVIEKLCILCDIFGKGASTPKEWHIRLRKATLPSVYPRIVPWSKIRDGEESVNVKLPPWPTLNEFILAMQTLNPIQKVRNFWNVKVQNGIMRRKNPWKHFNCRWNLTRQGNRFNRKYLLVFD